MSSNEKDKKDVNEKMNDDDSDDVTLRTLDHKIDQILEEAKGNNNNLFPFQQIKIIKYCRHE